MNPQELIKVKAKQTTGVLGVRKGSCQLRGLQNAPGSFLMGPGSRASMIWEGPWLWRSWQSGRFRHQKSMVRIPTSAMINLYLNVIICQLQPSKDENKEKEARKGPFF